MRNIVAIIIVVLFLSSGCTKKWKNMTHLSDDDLEWVSVYAPDKEVKFVSDSGGTDTLRYTSNGLFNDTTETIDFFKAYLIGTDGNYEAHASYDFIVSHNGKAIGGAFIIVRLVSKEGLRCYYRFSGLHSINYCISLSDSTREIGGTIYNNVFTADSTNSTYYTYKSEFEEEGCLVETFVVSKTKGIIYYKYSTGEEYFIREPQ